MRIAVTMRRLVFIGFAATAGVAVSSCARNRDVYDISAQRNRPWDSREEAAYRRWEVERHMDHMDYARRRTEDQRAYWEWRRDHPD